MHIHNNILSQQCSDCATMCTCDQNLCAYGEKKKLLKKKYKEITKIATYTSLERYTNTRTQVKLRGNFTVVKACVPVAVCRYRQYYSSSYLFLYQIVKYY